MTIVTLIERLGAWADRASSAPTRAGRADLVAVAIVVGMALLLASSPAVCFSDMPFDAFVPLDGGWRVYSGQWPHFDFHTPVGDLYYAAYGAGMWLLGPGARVLLAVPAVTGVVVALLTIVGLRDRLAPVPRGLVAVYLGALVVSPRHLDSDALVHLASYNRVGWALVSVALAVVALPPRRGGRNGAIADAVLVTGILVALAFVKITYFMLGGLGVILAVALVRENRWMALAAGVATWAVLGLLFAVSEVPGLYVQDIARALASVVPEEANDRVAGPAKLVIDLTANGLTVAFVLGGLLWAARQAGDGEQARPTSLRILMAGGALGAVVLVNVQSHDHHIPGLIVAMVLVHELLVQLPEGVRSKWATRAGLAALALVVGRMLAADVQALVAHRVLASSDGLSVPLSADPTSPLHDLRIADTSGAPSRIQLVVDGALDGETYAQLDVERTGADYQVMMEEGLRALSVAPPGSTGISLAFSSWVAWATRTPPPRGAEAWYDYARTFGGDNPILPEELLAEVDVALTPAFESNEDILQYVEPYLDAHYERHETPLWTVWVRTAR